MRTVRGSGNGDEMVSRHPTAVSTGLVASSARNSISFRAVWGHSPRVAVGPSGVGGLRFLFERDVQSATTAGERSIFARRQYRTKPRKHADVPCGSVERCESFILRRTSPSVSSSAGPRASKLNPDRVFVGSGRHEGRRCSAAGASQGLPGYGRIGNGWCFALVRIVGGRRDIWARIQPDAYVEGAVVSWRSRVARCFRPRPSARCARHSATGCVRG